MEIRNTRIDAQHYGNAPVDFLYSAEQEILLDDGKTIFVSMQTLFGSWVYWAANTMSLFDENIDSCEPFELYFDEDEAFASTYGENFKELNEAIDRKIDTTMEWLDDTKYFGARFGAQMNKDGLTAYVEGAKFCPEKNDFIYLQVRKTGDNYEFLATEQSIFLQMDLGHFYEAYYGNKPPVKTILTIDNLNDLGDLAFLRETFESLTSYLEGNLEEMHSQSPEN